MGFFNPSKESDSDLRQGMELDAEIAEEARRTGSKGREAAAHKSLNARLDVAESRGFFGRKKS